MIPVLNTEQESSFLASIAACDGCSSGCCDRRAFPMMTANGLANNRIYETERTLILIV